MKRFSRRRKPEMPSPNAEPDRYFAAWKSQAHETSFADVQAWLHRNVRSRPARRVLPQPRLQTIMTYFTLHRRRLALMSLLLATLFVACNLPVEQEETFGFMLSGEIGDEPLHVLPRVKALSWVQPGQMTLTQFQPRAPEELEKTKSQAAAEGQGTFAFRTVADIRFAIVLPEADERQAASWKHELEAIDGVTGVTLEPLQAMVERPVYKAAFYSFRHSVQSDHSVTMFELKLDEGDVEHVIEERLENLRMHGIDAVHVTREDGQRVLELTAPVPIDGSLTQDSLKHFLMEMKPSQTP